MLGWVVLGMAIGAVAITVIDKFWESIAQWLNNTAADVVGRYLGYKARNYMHRAVSTVSRIRDNLHNTSIIYTKKTPRDSFYEKVTCEVDAPVYTVDKGVLNEIKKQGQLEQTFEYRN